MTIDADDLRRLDRWIAAGESPEEVERRVGAARALLYDGRTPEEIASVKELIEQVKAEPEAPTTAPPQPAHLGLVDPSRPGYKRAQREEPIGAQQVALRARARGSPFAATSTIERERPAPTNKVDLAAELARLGRGGR